MNPDPPMGASRSPLASLRQFVRPKAVRERCELCDAELAEDHSHLVEPVQPEANLRMRGLRILFSSQGAAKYHRVPRRVRFLPDFRLTDEAWESLHLPINLAFFLHSTAAGRVVALYPSPAGATESLVTLEAWQTLIEDNPVLRDLEPDVEALLVNRIKETGECYRVGIDVCYHLVGLIRLHWRGLSGGQAVWDEIGRFFAELKRRSG